MSVRRRRRLRHKAAVAGTDTGGTRESVAPALRRNLPGLKEKNNFALFISFSRFISSPFYHMLLLYLCFASQMATLGFLLRVHMAGEPDSIGAL